MPPGPAGGREETAEETSAQGRAEAAVGEEDWAGGMEETLKQVRLLPQGGGGTALGRAVCCLCHVVAAGRYGGSPGSSVLSVMQPACLPHARPSAVLWCSMRHVGGPPTARRAVGGGHGPRAPATGAVSRVGGAARTCASRAGRPGRGRRAGTRPLCLSACASPLHRVPARISTLLMLLIYCTSSQHWHMHWHMPLLQ